MSGDCFPTAGRLVTGRFTDDPSARLCHGIAVGTGDDNHGQRFWHAWVEYDEESIVPLPDGTPYTIRLTRVVDQANGHDVDLPAALYHKIGGVNPTEVWRYETAEAAVLMVKEGHWGPWVELDEEVL